MFPGAEADVKLGTTATVRTIVSGSFPLLELWANVDESMSQFVMFCKFVVSCHHHPDVGPPRKSQTSRRPRHDFANKISQYFVNSLQQYIFEFTRQYRKYQCSLYDGLRKFQ